MEWWRMPGAGATSARLRQTGAGAFAAQAAVP